MPALPAVLALAFGLGGDPVAPSAAAGCDPAGSRYYMLLFGGQSVPFEARTAHTWATWVKATPVVSGAVALEVVTISWLPADLEVRPLVLRKKVGRNWTLEETLAIMARHHSQVSVWGPYETDAGRYEAAVAQARRLESGAVRFRSLDSFTRRRDVVHCVHAITFADPVVQKYFQPVLRVGEPGTSRLADKYLRGGAFPRYPQTHDWLLAALGLDQAGLIRREPGERIPRERR